MAAIFFESFNTTVNPAYWTLTTNGISNPFGYGNVLGEGNGFSISSNSGGSAGTAVAQAQLAFTNQTSGKVYVGFRVLAGLWVGYYDPYEHKLCTFHDNSGAEICSIYIKPGRTSNEFTVLVMQGLSARANYYLSSPVLTNINNGYTSAAHHWEFELDVDNNTLAIRVNGQYLTGANPSSPLLLMTSFASVARFSLYGYVFPNPYQTIYFDDVYVVNNSGTYANTWLGPDTRVRARGMNPYDAYTNDNWTPGAYPQPLSSNDGDASYISTKTQGALFALSYSAMSLPAGTAIGGVKVSSVARAVSLPVAYKHVFHDSAAPATYEVGDTAVLGQNNNVNYPTGGTRSLVTFFMQNPATSAQWTATQLDTTTNRFGFKTVAVPS